jgi:DNA-binding NarL/FixJ family response regulator
MDQKTRVAIVADDHELMREALRLVLTMRLGFAQAITVSSFDEALEQLTATPGVSLALFDLHMPGLENAASVGAVRECFPDVRVAMVSGSTDRQDILQALEAGVHGYIPKALSTDEICEALRSILDGHVYVPATLPDIRRAGGPRPKPAAASDELSRLTRRQREVLELITEGKSNKEIARALRLGEGTVKIHVAAVLQALSVPNRSAAAVAGTRMLHGRGLRG